MSQLSNTLRLILDQLGYFLPEGILAIGAMSLLLLVAVKPSVLMLRISTSIILLITLYFLPRQVGEFFQGHIIADHLNHQMKWLLLLVTLLIVWFSKRKHHHITYYFLLLSGLIGAFFMMTGAHFLLIYIGIELASFSAYFLTGLRLKPKSAEATIKYVLFGGITSSVMLYGISLLYGSSQSLLLSEMIDTNLSFIGLLLFFAGLTFKASLLPFHLWTPSTYQEAPTDVVAYLSIVPKVAAFVLIYHVLDLLPEALSLRMIVPLVGVALTTVLWGTIGAIPQVKVKRMLAYGAIAHSGFILPLTLMGEAGLQAFTYYVMIYAVMNIGIFYVIHLHESDQSKSLKFKDLAGFGRQAPVFGAAAVVFLVALVGLPPTGGFNAKLFLFSSILVQYQASGEWIWLTFLVVGILTSLFSLYYYFQLPIQYFLKAGDQPVLIPSVWQQIAATILAVIMLLFFIQPEILNSFVF